MREERGGDRRRKEMEVDTVYMQQQTVGFVSSTQYYHYSLTMPVLSFFQALHQQNCHHLIYAMWLQYS